MLLAAFAAAGHGAPAYPGSPDSHTPLADVPTLGHPLPFHYDLYTFRGRSIGGRRATDVVAAFAVPAGRLEREVRGAEVRYRFDVTLVVADTARRVVYRTDDSVYVSLPSALAGDHLLFTHVAVQTPPSRTTLQRVIMTDATTPGIGQLYSTPFPVPDYSGTALMVSDVALGQPSNGTGWRRGDVALALLPTSQFPESAFEVYYEIYNMPRGHAYTTEITVERIDARTGGPVAGSAVAVRYAGEAEPDRDGVIQELRRVDTSVGRGRHRLTVRVTDDVTRRSASRSRYFEVRGWGPGATLVTALPWKPDATSPQRR